MSESLVSRALAKIGRAIHRVVHPQYEDERKQLDQIARAINTSASAQREQLDHLRTRVDKLAKHTSELALDRDVRGLDRRVEALRDASVRQHKTLTQALKFADWEEELRVDERRLAHRLATVAKTKQPVLVGPWSGEVGFELLYWIPFVTWALKQAEVAPERIVVLSRGGPASWYAHLGGRYIDIFSHISPDTFRAQTEERKKQQTMGPFDREMVRTVLAGAGIGRPFLLHPGLMYRLFKPFWKQKATVRRIEQYAQHGLIARPVLAELAGRLPADYIAVRFYFSNCFPDTETNRAFVENTVKGLAESIDIVMLNTAFNVDDHRDYAPGRSTRIHTIADLMKPERNLEVQTAVIAGARAFVGTYGGYSYLAPLLSVPSVAFFSVRDAFFAHHLELAERVFRRIGAGSLVALDVRDTDLVQMVLGSHAIIRS